MRKRDGATQSGHHSHITEMPFDEADWVDWDHWQTVEELQNFMNGLTDIPTAESALADTVENGRRDHIMRQIQRHGLEVDA